MREKGLVYAYGALILCSIVTLAVMALVYETYVVSLGILLTGVLSMLFWAKDIRREKVHQEKIIVWYLVGVILLLLQNIEQWVMGINGLDQFYIYQLFSLFSIGIASFFMFGSFLLSIKHTLGLFSTYALFLWSIVQSIIIWLSFMLKDSIYSSGHMVSVILFIFGILGLKQLLGGVIHERR